MNANINTKAKMVFAINSGAILCILLVTRLPSLTTFCKQLKFEFNKIMSEIFLASLEALDKVIEQSALLSASKSLMPSPIIETVLFDSFNSAIIASFCSGDAFPKTV